MSYYEVKYRASYYCIKTKYVKAELGVTDAIRKTRLKYNKVISVKEIDEKEYKLIKVRERENKTK